MKIYKCDDCQQTTRLRLLDAWVKDEDASEPQALLCEKCHANRGPSAWGPWCEGVGEE